MSTINFEELIAEFQARGFDYMPTSRCGNYINDAYLIDVCEEEDWPFLEATASGAAPLQIADLRTVEYVIDTTQTRQLDPIKRGRIVDGMGVDLAETGSPAAYYLTGVDTVNVYPVAANQLSVRYWKAPSALSGTDEPLSPKRFHSMLVDAAVARAYEDSDDYELAAAAKGRFDERFGKMQESLGMMQHDAPDDYIVVEDPAALG